MLWFTEPAGRKTLLALRALKLGDLLVAVPALAGLRRACPEHAMLLAVPGWLEPIARLVHGVDGLVPTPGLDDPIRVEPGTVDIAVNLHGNGAESARLIRLLRPAHTMQHGDGGPAWRDGMLERRRWVRLVRHYGVAADENDVRIGVPAEPPAVAGAAVVHVGAFYGSRHWPTERFGAVARGLADDGHRVLFTGSAADRERALAAAHAGGFGEDAVVASRMDLAGFAATVAHAAIVVSADTGAAHLASAYGTPSVVLFGPAPPEEWGPPPGPHVVLTEASLRRGETFADEPDPALLAVGADRVLRAARSLGPGGAPGA